MTGAIFESNAQNREDVLLWRALHDITDGRYVDVGANHPRLDSVSRAFYDRGWRGITVEPMPTFAALHRDERPEDLLVEAAITDSSGGSIVMHEFEGTGLSTLIDAIGAKHLAAGIEGVDIEVPTRRLDDVLEAAGWGDSDIHFMSIDVEGAEDQVLRSVDLTRWRPWILVVEATLPELMRDAAGPIAPAPAYQEWEPLVLAAGYQYCFFDGLSRFYVADEKVDELGPKLSYPACILDNFTSLDHRRLAAERDSARHDVAAITEDVIRWRAAALTKWSEAAAGRGPGGGARQQEVERLRGEIDRIHQTLSWRITAPLRAVRGRSGAGRTR